MAERSEVTELLSADHDRLDGLLREAVADPEAVDETAYERFREGLLQHIAMEGKVLFRAIAEAEGRPHPDVERLHKDHAFIATMLTIRPTHQLIAELREVLERHNAMEEAEDGVYARCDALGQDTARNVAERMRNVPPVKVAPYRRGG